MRPPPTKRAPAPSANSEAALVPPVFGSCFFFSAFFSAFFAAFRAGGGAGAAFGAGAGAGAALGAAAADAAWLTSCLHSVDPLGLVVIVEPFSSNSNSSVSELASIKSVAPCALPLWPVACIGAHWLALLPLPETSND